jgi:hypothetical protein
MKSIESPSYRTAATSVEGFLKYTENSTYALRRVGIIMEQSKLEKIFSWKSSLSNCKETCETVCVLLITLPKSGFIMDPCRLRSKLFSIVW